jgi:hypothetical protein
LHTLNPDYAHWEQRVPALTEQVMALSTQSQAMLMLTGNVYNFGRNLPAVLNESTRFDPSMPEARQRIALESSLQLAAREQGLCGEVIRAGNFLAPADGGATWLDLGMVRRLPHGVFSAMSSTNAATPWAWRPDLAQVIVQVAQRRQALAVRSGGHHVLHYAGHTLSDSEFKTALERVTGRPLRSGRLPWWLLRLLSPVSRLHGALVEMRYLSDTRHRLDDSRLQALLGTMPPCTPIDTCLGVALAVDRPTSARATALATH